MKKIKCKVCGKRFVAQNEKRYIAHQSVQGIMPLTFRKPKLECFDCPRCGCQVVANIRNEEIKPDGLSAAFTWIDEMHELKKRPRTKRRGGP